MLGPVSTQPALPVGFDSAGPDNADEMWLAHRLTVAVNLLCLPALAVPEGTSADQNPQGIQMVGGRYQEGVCMRLATYIQAAVPS